MVLEKGGKVITSILLIFVVIIAFAAIQARDLLNSIMFLGAYSLFMALVWTRLNAMDVAFTEAAVGAGVSGVFMMAAIAKTSRFEANYKKRGILRYTPVVVAFLSAFVLFYATLDLPRYNDPEAPINKHVAPYYIENSIKDTESQNIVTAVLGSYRGFDTMGEVTVVFTAAISVILLLRRREDER
jgi:multicomponent Na+:H+ antiporter subunit B